VLTAGVAATRASLGARLLAAYALGSLAHGGFSPLVSDVDLGLVLADPLRPGDAAAVEEAAASVRGSGAPLADRLSVFWGTPSTLRGERDGGRFPPLDRLDLIEHGRLLTGAEARSGLPRPDTAELVVSGAAFALDALAGEDTLRDLRSPEGALARGARAVTKLVLYPPRFLYTAETGRVGTNDAAAAHHVAAGRPGARLVASALAWRTDPPDDDAAAAALLRAELVPLYRTYVDDHVARLAALGQAGLAAAFAAWRERLPTA
jgi:hypothetical protein